MFNNIKFVSITVKRLPKLFNQIAIVFVALVDLHVHGLHLRFLD